MKMNKEHKGKFFVPMYDIDLVWHTHQHMATSYKRDTEAYFGEYNKLYLLRFIYIMATATSLHIGSLKKLLKVNFRE